MRTYLWLFLTLLSFGTVAAETDALITVHGSGVVLGTPDQARLSMSVISRQKDVPSAKKDVDQKVQQLTQLLLQTGIIAAEINNAPLRIYPEYPNDQSKVELYRVERELVVLIKDLRIYPDVLSQVSAAGITQLQPAELIVSDPTPLYQQAMALAFKDAEQKAKQLATLSGRKIKQVHQIQEQGMSPAPQFKMAMMAAEAVQFGSQDIRADLTIQFELANN